jgi:myo-inositol catabolism protein IolC
MSSGYTQPLYVPPFDHRASFERGLFGWRGPLDAAQTARISDAKRVVYDAFVAAVEGGVPGEKSAILVDEQFGAAILRDARAAGYISCVPAERSGQDEFDFEFGEDFQEHITDFSPAFSKVLVRYNAEGEAAMNDRQASRLRRLSDYLRGSTTKFMFELLVPATPDQLQQCGGNVHVYDAQLRPALMVRAIRELQDAGVEPDVWKVEGLDARMGYKHIVDVARRGGRHEVGYIVLGRAEREEHVRTWLELAAAVPGFIGFAVGRTTFWEPLLALRDDKITRDAAVAEIARGYRAWVDVFEASSA